MPWSKTGATHYPAKLGLAEKGSAIKGLEKKVVQSKGWLSAIVGI